MNWQASNPPCHFDRSDSMAAAGGYGCSRLRSWIAGAARRGSPPEPQRSELAAAAPDVVIALFPPWPRPSQSVPSPCQLFEYCLFVQY